MKKIIRTFCLLMPLIAFNLSCKKNKGIEFDINYSTNLNVPASSYTASTMGQFTSPDVATEAASKFSSQKTASDHISEIKMTRFMLTAGAGANLDAINSYTVYISSDGLNEAQVASKTNIPAGSTSIASDLSDVNIKEYIFKDKIRFRIALVTNAGTFSAQEVKMDQTMHVKATLIK